MLVLAIESSTSSAKAILYDTEKGIIKSSKQAYEKEIETEGATNAEGVFQLSMKIAKAIAGGEKVEAVSLCGTWHGLCACDKRMKPVSPVYSWNFTKAAPICDRIRRDEKVKHTIYHNTGCMPHVTYPRHAIQYMEQQGMHISDKLFATQGGYSFYRITGEFLESVSTHSGSGLINLKEKRYDAYTLKMLGIKEQQLGSLVDYRENRPLNTYGAKLLGIPEGIPVVPAHPDGALNQIGSHAGRPGTMTISIGTSGALRMASPRPILPQKNQLWCYCGAENWIAGAAIAGACNCIDWFKDKLCGGRLTYEELENKTGKNSHLPVFLPFLYGERCPGWNDLKRGGFSFLEETHGIKEMYQAVQMGILYNLYQCYEVICQEYEEPARIVVSGGVTNSKHWTQMLADIFQKEIHISSFKDASSLGAVALGLYTCGELKDINDFKMHGEPDTVVQPQNDEAGYYHFYYKKYLEAYHLDA